jgi:hypothetical protein
VAITARRALKKRVASAPLASSGANGSANRTTHRLRTKITAATNEHPQSRGSVPPADSARPILEQGQLGRGSQVGGEVRWQAWPEVQPVLRDQRLRALEQRTLVVRRRCESASGGFDATMTSRTGRLLIAVIALLVVGVVIVVSVWPTGEGQTGGTSQSTL